ncbi:MAG: dihydropteroate synthase, partial [Paracoccaceae bacterium]
MAVDYYRPMVQHGATQPDGAVPLLGGSMWFVHAEKLTRSDTSRVVDAVEIPSDILQNLTAARAPFCGLDMSKPSIMGILNATPDSFSDGGVHHAIDDAVRGAKAMIAAGADIVDIGGESTRPGAGFVEIEDEVRRTAPVIMALCDAGVDTPISIDTRKAKVAQAALDAGAQLFNDVTALTFDPDSLETAASAGAGVCIMHASGDPKTMQDNPEYDNVLLDVYDYL